MGLALGLVGDIGANVVRFGLTPLGGDGPPTVSYRQDFFAYDFANAREAISAYLRSVDVPVVAAAFAVAGLIEGDRARLTNSDWAISGAEIAKAVNLGEVCLLNECAAAALSLPHLSATDIEWIGGPRVNASASEGRRTFGVISLAAGLGVAGLIVEGGRSVAIASEGGHASFAPTGELQTTIWKSIEKLHGRVSYEKVLSERGLQILHSALQRVSGVPNDPLSAAEIVRLADGGADWICVETIRLFCDVLGAFAGDVALLLGASEGLYLTGELMRPLGRTLRSGSFRRCFEEKTPLKPYLQIIPTPLVKHLSPGLIGLAARMRDNHVGVARVKSA